MKVVEVSEREDAKWRLQSGTVPKRGTTSSHKQIVKPLSHTCDHMWRASVRSEKKCACVRTVRCYLYTPRRVHGSRHCLKAILPETTKNLRSVQDHKWSPDSSELDYN